MGSDKKDDALKECIEQLTPKQKVQLISCFKRLQTLGPRMPSNYFDKAEGSKKRLTEFRVSVQDNEIRFLFKRIGNVFLMLKGGKKVKAATFRQWVKTADNRLIEWEKSNAT